MELASLVYAMLLLVVPWCAILWICLPRSTAGHLQLSLGYGVIAGLLIMPIMMRAQQWIWGRLDFTTPAIVATLIMVVAVIVGYRAKSVATDVAAAQSPRETDARSWMRLLQYVCLGLMALRLANLTVELVLQPLFAWDATMHWATKSRVWFEAEAMQPFVHHSIWLDSRIPEVYTDRHPDYPYTIPLLQTWINLSLGRWNSSLMNLPWLLCYSALGLLFYGQLRYARVKRSFATIVTYMLLSMPLLNTHVALAGYADMFLATTYGGALMAFYNWHCRRESWQLALTVLMALSGLLLKNEGFFWLLAFIPGVIMVRWPGYRGLVIIGSLVVPALLLLWLFPRDFEVAGHTLARLDLEYRAGAFQGVLKGFFVADNWHLVSYLVCLFLPLTLLIRPSSRERLAPLAVVLCAALAMYLFLFLFTRFSYGAFHQTAVSRISMHLMPALTFLVVICWTYLDHRGRSEEH